ncbi:hypothetical protein CEQ90_13350 [Lewinellaceae bacterium SD302]|nr:hypothetical protein CEQ90_13350 [Lewinellaceae bacterium SD302]
MLGVSEMDTTEFTKNWINTKKLEAVYGNKAVTAHGELTFVADTGDYISGGVVYCLDVENGDNVRNFIPYRLEKDVLSLVPYSDENYELYRALTFLCFGDFAKAYEENLCIESVKGEKSLNLVELYLKKWESGSLQRKCH